MPHDFYVPTIFIFQLTSPSSRHSHLLFTIYRLSVNKRPPVTHYDNIFAKHYNNIYSEKRVLRSYIACIDILFT